MAEEEETTRWREQQKCTSQAIKKTNKQTNKKIFGRVEVVLKKSVLKNEYSYITKWNYV